MGCSQGTAASAGLKRVSSPSSTLLDGSSLLHGQDDMKAFNAAQSSRCLLTNVDGVAGRKAVEGFIPPLGPTLLGSGSDPSSVVLHSAKLGGKWIADGSQDVVVVEHDNIDRSSGSSKRWLIAAYNDGYLKVVELDVSSFHDQLYVQAVSSRHQRQMKSVPGCKVDAGTEAIMALESMATAPVAISSDALGFGVQFLVFSHQHDSDDSTSKDSTQSGGRTNTSRSTDEQATSPEKFNLAEKFNEPANWNLPAQEAPWDEAVVIVTSGEDNARGRWACC